jgi:hypothetical protein
MSEPSSEESQEDVDAELDQEDLDEVSGAGGGDLLPPEINSGRMYSGPG